MLRKVQEDIEDDMRRQRGQAHRAKMKVMWSMAPNGYANLRGRTRPGAYLGEGPLPLEATHSQRDPRVERALQKYQWDDQGRRHRLQPPMAGEASALEEAFKAIKQAAANSYVQSLDIKKVIGWLAVCDQLIHEYCGLLVSLSRLFLFLSSYTIFLFSFFHSFFRTTFLI